MDTWLIFKYKLVAPWGHLEQLLFILLPPMALMSGNAQTLPTWCLPPGSFLKLPASPMGSQSQESGQSFPWYWLPAQLGPGSRVTQLCSKAQQRPIASNHHRPLPESMWLLAFPVGGTLPQPGEAGALEGGNRAECHLLQAMGQSQENLSALVAGGQRCSRNPSPQAEIPPQYEEKWSLSPHCSGMS